MYAFGLFSPCGVLVLRQFRVQFFIVAIVVAGCSTVAITGRNQLNLVSDGELRKAADANYSQFLAAAKSKNAILEKAESTEAANIISSVQRVSANIINAAELNGKYNWQVLVVKSKTPNAFVLPNGKITVYTGILPIAKNEAGLAAIIGHEVAHVVARHSAERMSQSLLANTAAQAVDVALVLNNNKNRPLVAAALGLGLQYGVMLPFSRSHESEADRIGQIYAARAGYDPAEAIAVWERMGASGGATNFEFASTHPSSATRIAQLREWLPEAKLYYLDRSKSLPKNTEELVAARMRADEAALAAPVALLPMIYGGDKWVFRDVKLNSEKEQEVKSVKECEFGTCVTLLNGADTVTMTNDFRRVRLDKADNTWFQISPPVREIQFPLSVGKTWEDEVEVSNSDGKKQKMRFRREVVSYEAVAIPGGNCMSYRIVTTLNGLRSSDSWFCPEVRGFAKFTNVSNGQDRTVVLVRHQAGYASSVTDF